MPCSYCCTTRSERPTTVAPARMISTMMIIRAATIGHTSSLAEVPRRRPFLLQPSDKREARRYTAGRGWPAVSRRMWWPGGDSLLRVRARDTDWEGVRLHVVTGKGGTGKTTVAGALAIALASGGRRVLLMEVEGRQGIARLFDCPPLPYAERRVAVAPGTPTLPGGEVYALAADPEAALLEYLEMFYNLRHAGTALTRLGVVDFATTIAPGLRDVLLTGKAVEATRRRSGGRLYYDAVVMDAPPTGRIGNFLNVATEVSGLAKVGPIRGHADTVQSVIKSPQTAVHFVTVLEEMPVQETLDGIAELRGLAQGGLQLGGIMINMVRPVDLTDDQLRAAAAGPWTSTSWTPA